VVVGRKHPLDVAVEVTDHGVELAEPDPDACHGAKGTWGRSGHEAGRSGRLA